ncbi:Heme exporter protein D (CcmD) [Aliiroseovarius crassostreae]|uniref:heme exporter protein CcmD n=1 Tax=Aliiroseovarius crassostreae TaxID=154981 RepID=UPI0008E2F3EB|nr:heme exporter protein CcmD [Aliiroseovarius crassostreae]SFU42138.1 Heme exporter protein D (CcmD) [Aliiroseovarius crassostreae]
MLELGKYADAILWSWGLTLALVGALIFVTIRSGRKVKTDLNVAEERRKNG